MGSVVLKNGVEELWTTSRVVRFIESLGYRAISLKSSTEPAIIAFRSRVVEGCSAEVRTEDAVKGDKQTNGLSENSVVQLRGTTNKERSSVILNVPRENQSETLRQSCHGWWNTQETFCSGARKGEMVGHHV